MLEDATKKSEKCVAPVQFAKAARIFYPRQPPKLSNDLDLYVTKESTKGVVQRVFLDYVKCLLQKGEWGQYWGLPPANGHLDVVQSWKSMQSQQQARIALRTLPIPHTGCDVERSFSYYRLSRNSLQGNLKPEHHIEFCNE